MTEDIPFDAHSAALSWPLTSDVTGAQTVGFAKHNACFIPTGGAGGGDAVADTLRSTGERDPS